jgi:hypothetical protein
MSTIRPLARSDIPAVVALRQRSFTHSAQRNVEAAEAYFREIFFESPWTDDELPSLVYEDADGRVGGFVGVLTRRMCFRGEAIRVAVPTQFAVAPENRGLAGLQLTKRLFAGPQDLTLADVASESTRTLWERLGGETLPMHSLHWTHDLAPVTCGVMNIPGGVVWRAARRMARPIFRVADAAATSAQRLRERELVDGSETFDASTLEDKARTLAEIGQMGATLSGRYTASELVWLFTHLAAKPGIDQLRVVAVSNGGEGWQGWYAYAGGRGETGEVAHIAAQAGQYGAVFAHLVAHARARGLLALRGRLDPRHARAVREPVRLDGTGPWVAVQTKRPELVAALHRPDAHLSRLDGEWWLNF